MEMSEQEADLIRESLYLAMQKMEAGDTSFYDAFFARVPEARNLFRDDLGGQEMKFMTTLKVIVDNIYQSDDLKPRYADLGESHAIIGVKPEYFAPMGEALMETLNRVLGDAFTPATEQAWKKLYAHVSGKVIENASLD